MELKEVALRLMDKYDLPVEDYAISNGRLLIFSPLADTYRATKRALGMLTEEAESLGLEVIWEDNPDENQFEEILHTWAEYELREQGKDPEDEEELERVIDSHYEKWKKDYLSEYPLWIEAQKLFKLDPFDFKSRGFIIAFSWKDSELLPKKLLEIEENLLLMLGYLVSMHHYATGERYFLLSRQQGELIEIAVRLENKGLLKHETPKNRKQRIKEFFTAEGLDRVRDLFKRTFGIDIEIML